MIHPDHRISLKCSNCNGTLTADENSNILFCPYCGSKEILLESDAVKIQKIKYETIKEIALEKQKTESERQQHESKIEKARLEEAKFAAFRAGKFSKVLILCAILCIMLGVGGLENCRFNLEYLPGSIISLIQGILFILAWVTGYGIIKLPRRNYYGLIVLTAFLLFIPFALLVP